MKLIVPPLNISETDGFSPELDIFHRKEFGENLLSLIANTDDELVIALDAPWGEGKSTFIKMWNGYLKGSGVSSIFFDAFENDYQQDPFLAITSQLYQLVEDTDTDAHQEYTEKALSALKIVGRVGLRIGIRTLTAGVLDESAVLEDVNTSEASSDIANAVDQALKSQLTGAKEEQACLAEFKDYLSTMTQNLSQDGKPVIFIVDELDRCKPKYALALIESIKHLFSTPKLTFVLVMNRSQLEEAVRNEYGSGVEAAIYLQKFISVWASLPKNEEQGFSTLGIYIDHCLNQMEYEFKGRDEEVAIGFYKELAIYYGMSLRDVEKSLTNYAIIVNAAGSNLVPHFLWLSVFISILKSNKPHLYRSMCENKISFTNLIRGCELDGLTARNWVDHAENHPIKWLLRVYLAEEEEAIELINERNYFNLDLTYPNAVKTICKWLETFQRD